VDTLEFVGDVTGRLRAIKIVEGFRDKRKRFHPTTATAQEIPAQLALLALGFGPEHGRLLADLGVQLDRRGHVARDENFMTSQDGVFVAGDMGRGQSLIVWAIAEGRAAAGGVDAHPTGRDCCPARSSRPDGPIA
jgi:glutamate synthase (NADPH/NADH) small chain